MAVGTVVWKLESAVAGTARLWGEWRELRSGRVCKETDPPGEEIVTSDRGTVTALESRGMALKRDRGGGRVENKLLTRERRQQVRPDDPERLG